MSVNHFRYHDKNDELTIALINELESLPGYWAKSENRILQRVDLFLKELPTPKNSFLDAGCGDGRLLSRFGGLYDNVVAIEPDQERLNTAVTMSQEIGIFEKCMFLKTKTEDYDSSEKFDFILCSHIIQHVGVLKVEKILSKLKKLIRDTGILVLMTCHSTKRNDYYVKDYFHNNNIYESEISETEFENIVNFSNGILPIHFFTYENLNKLLKKVGFKVFDFQVFHILNNFGLLDNIIGRDRLINNLPLLKSYFGRDMFIAAKPMRG